MIQKSDLLAMKPYLTKVYHVPKSNRATTWVSVTRQVRERWDDRAAHWLTIMRCRVWRYKRQVMFVSNHDDGTLWARAGRPARPKARVA